MPVPEEISNVFHNYKSELESLEQKYGWFRKENVSICDIFVGRNLENPLRSDALVPAYLRDEIEAIRQWYAEKKQYWESQQ